MYSPSTPTPTPTPTSPPKIQGQRRINRHLLDPLVTPRLPLDRRGTSLTLTGSRGIGTGTGSIVGVSGGSGVLLALGSLDNRGVVAELAETLCSAFLSMPKFRAVTP